MNKAQSSDKSARERIVKDLDTTFLVEAGAGSGKTTKLVDRIAALLALGKAQVHQIAAVTFTRKAAAELREKLQQRLEEQATGDPDPAVRKNLQAALADIGLAFIGTIHSFCARMLRERPVESGLDPEFGELDEAEAALFMEMCWQDFLSEAFLRNDPVMQKLGEFGIEGKELKDLYLRLCQFRDVEPLAPDCPKPDIAGARKMLDEFMSCVKAVMPKEEPEGGWDGLQTALRRAQWRLSQFDTIADRDLIRMLDSFDGCKVTLNRWPDRSVAKTLRDETLPRFIQEVVQKFVREWREYAHAACIRFSRAAAEFAAARRSVESKLDYTDLLIKTRDLLRDHEDVRLFLANRFKRIFVDEFQDTDPIQCEILFYLAGDRPSPNADWRSFMLRPGALFVVGDPKQSIYRFRRADIAAYNVVKELVQKSGGEALTLSANYRSVDSIGKFVDGVFQSVFPDEATEHQASFVPLATVKKDSAAICGVRKLAVDGVKNKNDVYARSAELIASWIRWALQGNVQIEEAGMLRPARPGDFLILTWQ
ncbi:MAG: UvrD-helicase domain-containing protein, partial [Acidobacteriota bacterium]|nr:UvrD-helicase domain-containing protein [Acidobacteriota bacterium]